jgi:arylsulfatase A-like enzyme
MIRSRRRSLAYAAFAALAALPLAGCRREPARVLNVVLVVADDLGCGDVSVLHPGAKLQTPHFDRLAREGVLMTHAYAPSSVCSPSRYALLTGRYAWRTGQHRALPPWSPPLVEPERVTLPELLRAHGYTTLALGKWHLGWEWPTHPGKELDAGSTGTEVDFTRPLRGGPLDHGFDRFFGIESANYPPYCFLEQDRAAVVPRELRREGNPGVQSASYDPAAILPALVELAEVWIDEHARTPERPFFLYFALTAPHPPIAPAPEFAGKSAAGPYGDFVVEVDWAIGRVCEALEHAGVADRTLLIVTSDNGAHHAPGPRGKHDSNHPFRGGKAKTWEGGLRVPFLARWPGHTVPGTQNDEPISLVDVMATVAAAAGVPLPEGAAPDGVDLLPALHGKPHPAPLREAIVCTSEPGLFAVRKGRWKWIEGTEADEPGERGRVPARGDPPARLYDVVADPQEKRNVYAAHPEVVAELTAILMRERNRERAPTAK